MTIRVMLIDDSPIALKAMKWILSQAPDIQVVATAPDPFQGRDPILQHRPDVLLLDVEMPRMDGVTFLRRLMEHHPMPVIMVSSLTRSGSRISLEALRAGAVDVASKPSAGENTLEELAPDIIAKVRAASGVRLNLPKSASGASAPPTPISTVLRPNSRKLLAIGASTGGTQAFERVLTRLPDNLPPMVVVQHMPRQFTGPYAERLNSLTPLTVKEAEHGEAIRAGLVLIAPGGQHLEVRNAGGVYRAVLSDAPPENRHRPAVDVLFRSVAREAGRNAIGALLTGMGEDGARGMLEMRQAGCSTLAQDEATCVVFGMPGAAIALDAAQQVLPLDRIAGALVQFAEGSKPGAAA